MSVLTPLVPDRMVVESTRSTAMLDDLENCNGRLSLDYSLALCETPEQRKRFVAGIFKALYRYEKECCQ